MIVAEKCDCILVAINMKTGEVECLTCGKIKEPVSKRVKMFSEMVKMVKK